MQIRLPRNGTLKIEGDARGVAIYCAKGLVWVTQPGDTTDHFLARQEEFVVNRKGVVMVEACREACVTITEPFSSDSIMFQNLFDSLLKGGKKF